MIDWKQSFLESIQQGAVDGLVEALHSQSTTHAGTAPAKIKHYAVKQLRKTDADKLYPLTLQLCCHENPTHKKLERFV